MSKRQRQSKIATKKAPSETPRQVVEVPVEDTIIDVIEEPVPGVVVITEYETISDGSSRCRVLSLSPASVPRRKIANGTKRTCRWGGRVPGTPEFVIPKTPFIVPYRLQRNVIQILRVYHWARRWATSF